jgi:hypothetical protein
MYDFNVHTILILLLTSGITLGLLCLATRLLKINLWTALLLSVVFGVASGFLGLGSYGLLMLWFGNWFGPLVLGLAVPRYSPLLGILTNTVALISIVWMAPPHSSAFDLHRLWEAFRMDMKDWLVYWLIGIGTSLLVTLPIFYYGYKKPLQKAASVEEASDEE